MKIGCLLLNGENNAVLSYIKKVNKNIKVIDKVSSDLSEYLKELEKNKEIAIINYNESIDLTGIYIDFFIFDNSDANFIKQNNETIKYLFKHSSKNSYLIINSDIKEIFKMLPKSRHYILDFGLNMRATITASSILNEKFLCCIQRSVKTLQNNIIEPQEILINIESQDYSIYSIICSLATLLICETNISDIEKTKF